MRLFEKQVYIGVYVYAFPPVNQTGVGKKKTSSPKKQKQTNTTKTKTNKAKSNTTHNQGLKKHTQTHIRTVKVINLW